MYATLPVHIRQRYNHSTFSLAVGSATADAYIKNPLVGAQGYQRVPLFKPEIGI